MADSETSWLDEAFDEQSGDASTERAGERDEDGRNWDWIDDAFDDEKTARDIAEARSMKPIGCLFGAVIVAVVRFCVFALGSVVGALR